MTKDAKILIVGGGIAGMAAAIRARQAGCTVDLVEKYSLAETLGIGITLPGNALRALDQLGVLDECIAAGAPFDGWLFTDSQGENRRRVPGARTAGPGRPAMLGMCRPDYVAILARAAAQAGTSIRNFTVVDHLTQVPDGVDVTFSDGTQGRYDAVIGADGIHSTIRKMVFGEAGLPIHSGQAGWRVYMPRLPEVNDLWLCDGGHGGKAGFVPLTSDLMYLYLTDTSPSREPPEGELAELMYEKLQIFGGPVAVCRDTYLRDGREVLWKTFDLVDLPPPWFKGRVIVVGDGAHAASAHLGQGGAMALEDGFVIGEELGQASDVADAFQNFMTRRFERASKIQNWSHQICRWEMERVADADYVGLTSKAFELVQEPI